MSRPSLLIPGRPLFPVSLHASLSLSLSSSFVPLSPTDDAAVPLPAARVIRKSSRKLGLALKHGKEVDADSPSTLAPLFLLPVDYPFFEPLFVGPIPIPPPQPSDDSTLIAVNAHTLSTSLHSFSPRAHRSCTVEALLLPTRPLEASSTLLYALTTTSRP